MIKTETYELEWIYEVESTLGKKKFDPKLIEKVIYALLFLEQLQLNGLDFIFKGGTALLLASKEPKRFSIDVDIITERTQEEIETVLERIVEQTIFNRWEDDNNRKHTPDAPVSHYKLYYNSEVDGKEEPILLDTLHTLNPYPKLIEIPIEHPWLQTSGKVSYVKMPTLDAILGDKLTAFAPKTTGILYSKERPVEIIKQLFDVAYLIDNISDLSTVRGSYAKVVKEEIAFRKLELSPEQVLSDTQEACFILSTRDKVSDEFKHLQQGISNFTNFTISRFNIEEAITAAAKAAYLAEVLKSGGITILEKYKEPLQIRDWLIENQKFNKLNKLKKSNPEAFFYWYKTIMIMTERELTLLPKEKEALKTAIEFYRYRNDFPNDDIILSIQAKLNNSAVLNFKEQELKYLNKILVENIDHIKKTNYPGLSMEFTESRRQENLEPLISIQEKVLEI